MRTLMPVRTGGSKPPLFCIHGEPLKMAQVLDPERPLYGIYNAYDPNFQEPERFEDLARLYLREARLIQPRGPYHLVGFCVGGLAAFEMARQLLAVGEQVAYLGLIDPTDPSRSYSRVEWARSLLSMPGQRLAALSFLIKRAGMSLSARSYTAYRMLRAYAYELAGIETPFHLRQVRHNSALRQAFRNYRYQPTPLKGVIFRADMSAAEAQQAQEYWNTIFQHGAKLIPVPGLVRHSDFMAEPYHTLICQQISVDLENSTSAPAVDAANASTPLR